VGHAEVVSRHPVERLEVTACRIPTEDALETDGTAEWSSTTIVIVEARASGVTGLGYSYVDAAAARVIADVFVDAVIGVDALAPPAAFARMGHAIRNHGRPGIAACAIAAVDAALWDLKAKLLDVPLARLLGAMRSALPVYASGGFTSTPIEALEREIAGYVAAGHRRVKLKIGRDPARDVERVRAARAAAGTGVELMVDANGAYTCKQACALADVFAELGVTYFEEPVSSDDLEGLRRVRDHAAIAIAAGEYGYDAIYFRRMLAAGAVDILQADATRCGVTGMQQADTLCAAFDVPLSAHCAPALHVHACAAAAKLIHLEMFRDHVRIEQLLFDGAPALEGGVLAWNPARAGVGLVPRREELQRHGV
jgi:L-alanine-DL-glutamate epimerase-like enolase superfamily enzyme